MAIIDINSNWIHMLTNIQCLLGVDAVIAGGALRDSYFNKPISDVDIFVYDNPNEPKSSVSANTFSSWNIALDVVNGEKIVIEYTDGSIVDDRPYKTKPQKDQDTHTKLISTNANIWSIQIGQIGGSNNCFNFQPMGLPSTQQKYVSKSCYENSNIRAVFSILKTDGTLYQIVVLKIPPIEYINRFFDVGLCKVYFDGKRTVLTPDFTTDASNNTLTLCGDFNKLTLHRSIKYHIPKILKKYPNRQVIISPSVFS